jgi:hypothetical protein
MECKEEDKCIREDMEETQTKEGIKDKNKEERGSRVIQPDRTLLLILAWEEDNKCKQFNSQRVHFWKI